MNGLFDLDDIARVVHEANRGLQAIHGDPMPAATWDDVSEDMRQRCREGVRDALAGSTPAELHEDWCEHLRRQGWVYGPIKSESAKTHPCLLPYEALPSVQRIKSEVFVAIVRAMGKAEPDPIGDVEPDCAMADEDPD